MRTLGVTYVATRGLPLSAGVPVAARLVAVDLSALSDEDLLELVAERRDGEAFEELYRRYSRAVYAVVRRMLGDHARSEDVVQEAFATVWRAARGYRRERGSRRRLAVRHRAQRRRRRAARTHARGRRRPARPGRSRPRPDERTAAELEAFKVHAAVDSLPEREREVIELAYFSGLSQSEVAERLSLPLGTVKTRTRSGLARLAERLAR